MNLDGTVDPNDPDDVCEHGESLGMYCPDCHWEDYHDDDDLDPSYDY